MSTYLVQKNQQHLLFPHYPVLDSILFLMTSFIQFCLKTEL